MQIQTNQHLTKPARTSGINISKFMFIRPALEPEKDANKAKMLQQPKLKKTEAHQHAFGPTSQLSFWQKFGKKKKKTTS